jgi:hypothetical protein
MRQGREGRVEALWLLVIIIILAWVLVLLVDGAVHRREGPTEVQYGIVFGKVYADRGAGTEVSCLVLVDTVCVSPNVYYEAVLGDTIRVERRNGVTRYLWVGFVDSSKTDRKGSPRNDDLDDGRPR